MGVSRQKPAGEPRVTHQFIGRLKFGGVKRDENTLSVGIGIGVAIAVAIGFCIPTQPTAIATATPIPIPMIVTQSEHDLRPAPHFLIKCPPVFELMGISEEINAGIYLRLSVVSTVELWNSRLGSWACGAEI
jgi:hypothetical protein